MKNVLERYFSILIVFCSVTGVVYGQTEKVIGKGYVESNPILARWQMVGDWHYSNP